MLFDTFNLDPSSISTSYYLKYNILASHVQLPLRNDEFITVMLIQKPLSKKDISEWIQSSSNSTSTTATLENEDPKIEEFIRNCKKNPPRTIEQASYKFLDFLHNLKVEDSERLDLIESYLCTQLHDQLFTNPDGDEAMQDEALESRIAALNLLDLNLNHLGVILQDQADIDNMNSIVKLAGNQLQQLNTIKGAKEKLDALIKTHEIIVNAIDEYATKKKTRLDQDAKVVQEMKHAISATTPTKEEHEKEEKEEEEEILSSANADVLLPILIFTIVKSNPTNFLSNLLFIQRYRRPEELHGQASYCLTNMVRVASLYIKSVFNS